MMSAYDAIHKTQRTGWLRGAVLGANDGIISFSSLMLGGGCRSPRQSTSPCFLRLSGTKPMPSCIAALGERI